MTRTKFAPMFLASALLVAAVASMPGGSPAGGAITTAGTRLVLGVGGAQPDGEIYDASFTPDRKHLVFTSLASNLVAGDTNGVADVFVKDMTSGTVSMVSRLPEGGEADADSYDPSICDSGRFVAFTTDSDLFDEENDFNFESDVYFVDRDNDGDTVFDEYAQPGAVRVRRASVGPEGVEADFGALAGQISGNCSWVTFMTGDPITEDDTNDAFDVYVRSTGASDDITRLLSKGSTTLGGGGELPAISQSGRYVTFGSTATDLVAGAPQPGLILHDRDSDNDGTFDENGATAREHVNKSTGGTVSGGSFDPSRRASISPDGSCIAFKFTNASNLTADATSNAAYVRNRSAGTTVLASKTKAGLTATEVANPAVSPNCRYVTFDSGDSALAPNDGSPARDVYVKDLQSGDLDRLSIEGGGDAATGPSESAQVFDDTAGLIVSSAPDIGGADGGTGARDPFLVDFTVVVPAPTCTPAAPTVGKATRTSVTVTVQKCTGTPNPAPTGYRVEAFAGSSATVAASLDVAAGAATATVTGLTAGERYRFRTRALNGTVTGPQSPLSAFALPPFRTFDQFTTQAFTDFAGRAPSASELSSWRTGLTNGTFNAAGQLSKANDFTNWAGIQSPVVRLFRAYFLRNPDLGGLNFWAGKRRTGTSLDAVSQSFAGSAEFKSRYGSLTNKAFVELVYQNVLGRPGDAAGVNYWTGQLDQGKKNRGQVMTGFSESTEYKNKTKILVDTVNVFTGMLRRVPTPAEYATWAPTPNTGPGRLAVITFLLASTGYDGRIPD